MENIATSTPKYTKRKRDFDQNSPPSRKQILAVGKEQLDQLPILVHLDKSDYEITFPKNMGLEDMDTGAAPAAKSAEDLRDERLVAMMKSHFDTSLNDMKRDIHNLYARVENKVAEHTVDIADIRGSIKRIERSMATGINLQSLPEQPVLQEKRLNPREEYTDEKRDSYTTSRRSLRLWPIPGTTDQELLDGTVKFILKTLEVPEEDFDVSNIARVRRVRTARTSKTPYEVLVTFDEKFSRDKIAKCAKNLEGYVDPEGYPTAGLKLDYPQFLSSVFRDLEWYGAFLKRSHGRGTKRNIRFDEENQSLIMHVRLPNKENEWLHVTPAMAKAEKEENKAEEEKNTRRKLKNTTVRPRPLQLATSRTPAGNPVQGGYSGKTQNFIDDMDRIEKRYANLPTPAKERRSQNTRTDAYRSPKKM